MNAVSPGPRTKYEGEGRLSTGRVHKATRDSLGNVKATDKTDNSFVS